MPHPLEILIRSLLWARTVIRISIYKILFPKDSLLKRTDRRYKGIWIGDAPRLLGRKDLKEGNILFAGRLEKSVITHATSSPLSHCGVLVFHRNELMVLEALPYKIEINKIEDFVARYDYVSVFNEPKFRKQHIRQGRDFAEACLQKRTKYAFLKAGALPIVEIMHQYRHWRINRAPDLSRTSRTNLGKSYFCSELVLEFFLQAGVAGFDLNYLKANRWTPGLLVEDSVFRFLGYVADRYTDIHPDDPILGGCGHLLKTWERARVCGDTATLHSFTYSLREQNLLPAPKFATTPRRHSLKKKREGRPWK